MLTSDEYEDFKSTIESLFTSTARVFRSSISSSTTADNAGDGYGGISNTVESRTVGFKEHADYLVHLQLRDRVGIGKELYDYSISTMKEIGKAIFPVDADLEMNDRIRIEIPDVVYDSDDPETYLEYDIMYIQHNTLQAGIHVLLQGIRNM